MASASEKENRTATDDALREVAGRRGVPKQERFCYVSASVLKKR